MSINSVNTTWYPFENRASIDAQTPKIPNVAQAFQIRTISRYQMLRLMGVEILFRY